LLVPDNFISPTIIGEVIKRANLPNQVRSFGRHGSEFIPPMARQMHTLPQVKIAAPAIVLEAVFS
jgi:hypothetical protein